MSSALVSVQVFWGPGVWQDFGPYGLRVVAHVNYGKSISVNIVYLRLRFLWSKVHR